MNYQNFITLSGELTVSLSESGGYIRRSPLVALLFAQNDPILRIEAGSLDNYATVRFSQSVGGGQTYANVSFSVSPVQYLPIKSLVLPLIDRQRIGYSTGIGVGATFGTITVQAFDADGNARGSNTTNIYMCDCGGVAQTGSSSDRLDHFPLSVNLPDTFRWFSGQYAFGYNLATVRMTNGTSVVKQLYANGVAAKTYTGTGVLGLPVSLNWQASVATIATFEGDGVTISEEARVIPVWQASCPEGQLLVYWWSNEHGGWKSRVADIVRPYSETVRTLDYLKNFDRREGREVRGGVMCRFENLTLRDMLYYRDLYSSDEVYVYTNRIAAGGSGVGSVAAIVRGETPLFKPAGAADFDFYLEIERYDSV